MPAKRKYKGETASAFKNRMSKKGAARKAANKRAKKKSATGY